MNLSMAVCTYKNAFPKFVLYVLPHVAKLNSAFLPRRIYVMEVINIPWILLSALFAEIAELFQTSLNIGLTPLTNTLIMMLSSAFRIPLSPLLGASYLMFSVISVVFLSSLVAVVFTSYVPAVLISEPKDVKVFMGVESFTFATIANFHIPSPR